MLPIVIHVAAGPLDGGDGVALDVGAMDDPPEPAPEDEDQDHQRPDAQADGPPFPAGGPLGRGHRRSPISRGVVGDRVGLLVELEVRVRLLVVGRVLPGDHRGRPRLAPLVVHGQAQAVQAGGGVLPLGAGLGLAGLDHQDDVGVGPQDEGEEAAVDHVRVGALVAEEGLREQPEVADGARPQGLVRVEFAGQGAELAEPGRRGLGRLGGAGIAFRATGAFPGDQAGWPSRSAEVSFGVRAWNSAPR